jgi:outer membrane protein OmpA-like peptidoglycan-associated protein
MNTFPYCRRAAAAAVVAALAWGCASIPANQALESARSTYQSIASNPTVTANAPVELEAARRALLAAEAAARDRTDSTEIAHQAYLAEQRARIAMQTAELRQAERAVETASEERNRVLLQARERQLEATRERLAAQQREAEQAAQVKQQQMQAQQQAELQATRERLAAEQRAAEEARRAAESRTGELNASVEQMKMQLRDMKSQQTDRGYVITLGGDLIFGTGEADLKPGARRSLDNLATFLRAHPKQVVVVEGFTDGQGSDQLNMQLSERRAQAVREALVAGGVDPAQIEARGYGKRYPVATNDTAAGRQLNRRVEVVIPPEQVRVTGREDATTGQAGSSPTGGRAGE